MLMISQKTRKRGITVVLTSQTKQRRLKVEGQAWEESGADVKSWLPPKAKLVFQTPMFARCVLMVCGPLGPEA